MKDTLASWVCPRILGLSFEGVPKGGNSIPSKFSCAESRRHIALLCWRGFSRRRCRLDVLARANAGPSHSFLCLFVYRFLVSVCLSVRRRQRKKKGEVLSKPNQTKTSFAVKVNCLSNGIIQEAFSSKSSARLSLFLLTFAILKKTSPRMIAPIPKSSAARHVLSTTCP
jgi:hypothetical protein